MNIINIVILYERFDTVYTKHTCKFLTVGYGQYTSWIRGIFYVGEGTIPIKPWLGYFWFIMCGIGWAAPGGILLGWAIGKRVSMQIWIVRSFLLAVLF